MPIRVVCPGCARHFVFPDASYGQRANCQACGVPMTIAPPPPQPGPGGASSWGSAAAPVQQPGVVPVPGLPTQGFPSQGFPMPGMPLQGYPQAGVPRSAAPPTGMPLPGVPQPGGSHAGIPRPAGMPMPQPGLPVGMPSLPNSPTLAGGATVPMNALPQAGMPTLPSGASLPEMNTGLPSLPTGGFGGIAAREPRFAPSAAAPWYASPWVWTGGGLGAVMLLGILFSALGGSGKSRSAKPTELAANSADASPAPEETRRPGFSRFVPGKPLRRGAAPADVAPQIASGTPGPAVPSNASPDASKPSVPVPVSPRPAVEPVSVARPTKEMPLKERFDKPRPAPPPPPEPAVMGPITERIPADVTDLLTPDRGTLPPGTEKHWELVPDPDPNYAPATSTTVNVPLFDLSANRSIPPYATPKPQPFVVLDHRSSIFGGPMRLLALPSGRKAADITTDPRSLASVLCVSADGKLVAGPVLEGAPEEADAPRGRLRTPTRVGMFDKEQPGRIAVVDSRSSKIRCNLDDPLDRPALSPSFFVAPDRLLIRTREGFTIWELPASGPAPTQPKGLIPWTGGAAVALTPGRNFLVGAEADRAGLAVRIFSVEDGKEVAHHVYPELKAPKESEVFLRPGKHGFGNTPSIAAPAISADGLEIALAVLDGERQAVTAIVDFDSGALRRRHVTADSSPREAWLDGADYLDWMPGSYGLLLGRHVIERATGKVVLSGPAPGPFDKFRPRTLPNGQVLQVVADRLEILPIPTKRMLAVVKQVREGGEAVDAGLPPLRAVDWTGAIEAGSGSTSDRRLEPDPSPANLARAFRSSPLDGVKVGDNHLRSLHFAPVKQGLIFASHFPLSSGMGRAMPSPVELAAVQGHFRVRELDSEAPSSVVELPAGIALEAVSPTANRLATLSRTGDRIDVWERAGLKHLAGVRPHSSEPASAEKTSMQDLFFPQAMFGKSRSARRIVWCGFADDHRLWTLTGAGKLVCWQLPEFKAIAVLADPDLRTVGFSPGHRVLAVVRSDRQQFLDGTTGEILAEFPLRDAKGESALAFSSDGKRFALVRGGQVIRLDLETGRRAEFFGLPKMGSEVRWLDANRILVDAMLYDFRIKAVLWNYEPRWNSWVRQEDFPDGHRWLTIIHKDIPRLIGVPLPDPTTQREFEKAAPEPFPPMLAVGHKVRFELDGANVPDLPALQAHFEHQARSNGFILAEDAEATFRITTEQVGQSDLQFYDKDRYPFGVTENTTQTNLPGLSVPGRPRQEKPTEGIRNVSVPIVDVRLELHHATRGVVWKITHRTSTPFMIGTSFTEEQVNDTANHSRHATAGFLWRIQIPPEILFQPRHEYDRPGYGTSLIGPDGTLTPADMEEFRPK